MSYQCGGETLVPVVKRCVSDTNTTRILMNRLPGGLAFAFF